MSNNICPDAALANYTQFIADNVTSKELLFTDRANSTTEFAICSSR